MTCACGCGEEFEPKRRDQRYKNRRHKERVCCRRWRARQPKKRLRCAAWACGREFKRVPKSRRIYCSDGCRIRANKATERAMKVACAQRVVHSTADMRRATMRAGGAA